MDISLDFPHEYVVEETCEPSGGKSATKRLYFPGGSPVGAEGGILLKLTPSKGEPWIGSFAFGARGRTSLTRIMSCPDKNKLCVVSSGSGYIVNVNQPATWERVRGTPICDARAVLSKRLLLFANFVKLSAYDADGLKWESARVSSDGIQITDVGNDRVQLIGWDAARQLKTHVSVSLDDGRILQE